MGWLINVCELSEMKLRAFVVGSLRLFHGRKPSKVYVASPTLKLGAPFVSIFSKCHTLNCPGQGGDVLRSVKGIQLSSALSEISPSIVERIVIFVIHLTFVANSQAEYDPMHSQRTSINLSCGVKAPRLFVPVRKPIPLIQPIEIFDINDRVLVLCQGDKTVRLVNWLADQMAFHFEFRSHVNLNFITGGALCRG